MSYAPTDQRKQSNFDMYRSPNYEGLLKINEELFVVSSCDEQHLQTGTNGYHDDGEFSESGLLDRKWKRNRNERTTIKLKQPKKNALTICLSHCRYNVIGEIAKGLGYRLADEDDLWNIFWSETVMGVDFYKGMKRFQKVNHFPGMFEICRKDLLARNLNRMQRLFPLDYKIYPKTWCFPADFGDAISYSRTHKNKTFIIKPDQGSRGRGIWLTKSLKKIKLTERMICQVYISRPLLIDGYKFDLRVYALITSADPLRIYVYQEGLARFATSPYFEPAGCNTSNMFMHLTNYSVNRYSHSFSNDQEAGSKRTFATLNRILCAKGYDIIEMWANVDDIIIKTVLSAWPMLKHNYNACFPTHDIVEACFEILGVDILIDHTMQPYILEINHSPSFHCHETVDQQVKEPLIRDTINLLNVSNNDKRKILDEDKRRVKNRLLRQIKSKSTHTADRVLEQERDTGCETQSEQQNIICGDWSSRTIAEINWEESHMGAYRRILPAPGEPNKYDRFFLSQNQVSVYGETVASKRREEYAKQHRSKLELKNAKHTTLAGQLQLQTAKDVAATLKTGRQPLKSTSTTLHVARIEDNFEPTAIFDADERERTNDMSQRNFLIRTCGLLQTIYLSFFRNSLLTDGDRQKYKDMFVKQASQQSQPYLLPVNGMANQQKPLQIKPIQR